MRNISCSLYSPLHSRYGRDSQASNELLGLQQMFLGFSPFVRLLQSGESLFTASKALAFFELCEEFLQVTDRRVDLWSAHGQNG